MKPVVYLHFLGLFESIGLKESTYHAAKGLDGDLRPAIDFGTHEKGNFRFPFDPLGNQTGCMGLIQNKTLHHATTALRTLLRRIHGQIPINSVTPCQVE